MGIHKRFFGIQVLKNVSLALPRGQTLGLVGENGAGKSTLMNILGGNEQPDAGEMWLMDQLYSPRNPQDATRHGIAFIHQELNLFTNLSIAENIFITAFPRWKNLPFIQRGKIQRQTTDLLKRVGLDIPSNTLVEKLSAGEQQLVEIAKALGMDARLIIFDEPTTSLTDREREHLFRLITQLQSQEVTMVYISHNLNDVLRLSDQVAVLRDGELVGIGSKQDFSVDRLVSLMVGRTLTQLFPPRSTRPSADVAFQVEQLAQPGMVQDINFALHRGEVLGLAGLMGSGRSELARILFGLDPFARGQIRVHGQPLRPGPRRNIQQGIAFLTENRRAEGLCPAASIADNLALVTLPQLAKPPFGWLDTVKLRQAVNGIRQVVGLTASARNEQPAKTLSGGNQQKVVLAKWLLRQPSVFILDEPTRGIDVGAKYEVYTLINQLAGRGAAILIISSEIEELIGLCDRILVMNHGEIRDELTRTEFDRERILRSALHEREDL